MPGAWWRELGPIGTLDDALEHVGALIDADVQSVALFPAPVLEVARHQMHDVAAIKRAYS